MPYSVAWADLPEVEVLPNNFRRSTAGLKSSVSLIRLVHPSETPLHHHDEEEQMVMMLEGEMQVTVGSETFVLRAGEICAMPAGTKHCFRSIAGEAKFLETFAPGRIQNLVGFLGKIF